MRFNFFSPLNFEKWYWKNLEKGIGGSETHHIEMTWRLAKRGHDVWSYSPTPWKGVRFNRNVKWFPLERAKFTDPGVWIIYRSPETMDKFSAKSRRQKRWLIMQDEDYPTWTKSRAAKLDRIFALCKTHAENVVRNHPYLKDKVFLTTNGVRVDLIRKVESSSIIRNPKKLVYASSPDRGLKNLIHIFTKAREFIPDLELHAFYGFNNIDKLIKFNKTFLRFKKIKEDLLRLMDTPGVTWHGRVNQKELYRHWLSAGIWCYPTNFTETSCITCMEAQALGAIPVTNPIWALAENVKHGTFIQGNPDGDPLTRARYAAEIVRLVSQPGLQDSIRKDMTQDIRYRFNWERAVDQFESLALGINNPAYISQYAFQLKHAAGKILNIGCDIDMPNFKALGAVNLDLRTESPIVKQKIKADIIADARALPEKLYNRFDTVILGDILEHYPENDIRNILRNANRCRFKDGKIVVTFPEDYRDPKTQHDRPIEPYSDHGSGTHNYPLTRNRVEKVVKELGLNVDLYQPIDYTFAEGHGLVVR